MGEWHECLSAGDGAIDIGANVGVITKHLARRVGPTGTVFAIEPDPLSVAQLRENVAPWPWVQVVQAVCMAADGQVAPFYKDSDSRRNSLWPANLMKSQEDNILLVPTVTLDTLAAWVPKLRVVKVDTQGAERLVLEGGMKTLARPNLTWHVEVWPFGLKNAGSSAREVLDLFRSHGYKPKGWDWDVLANKEHTNTHGAVDVVFSR